VCASRSQKVEKPTLGGTRFRQRKRNINVPLDHTSFADDVVAIFQDAAVDGADVESNLVRSQRRRRRARRLAREFCQRPRGLAFRPARLAAAGRRLLTLARAPRSPPLALPSLLARALGRQLAGVKALEVHGADLDYSRYGDTLFELLFTGGRFAGGSMELEYGESKLATNVRTWLPRPPRTGVP
jgi:hypothetical protein